MGLLSAQNAALGLSRAFTGSRSAVPLPLSPRAAAKLPDIVAVASVIDGSW
jgi:hypothetical protein